MRTLVCSTHQVFVVEEEDAKIVCSAYGPPDTTVEWYKVQSGTDVKLVANLTYQFNTVSLRIVKMHIIFSNKAQ